VNNTIQKLNLKLFEESKAYFLFISGLFMVLVHLLSVVFTNGEGYYQTPIVENIFYYSRFLAYFNITIPCVAAMTYLSIYIQNKHKPNFKFEYLKILIKLFVVLFLVENIMEVIMNLPNFTLDFYSFAVLQFTGLSLILLHLIVNFLGIYHLIGFGFLSLLSSPWLYELLRSKGYYVFSGSNNYEFQWPLFPWLFVPFLGFFISYIWVQCQKYKKYFFLTSLALFILLFYWVRTRVEVQLETRWGDAVFQPNTFLILQNILLVPILLYVSDKISNLRLLKRYDFVDTISRGILVFYATHVLVAEFIIIKLLNKKFIFQSVSEPANYFLLIKLTLIFCVIYIFLVWLSLQITKAFLIFFVDYKWTRGV
jgi:hypothetical protein